MYVSASIVVFISFITVLTLQHSKFGKLPSGNRLERIKKSPNYKNGSFQNESFTPVMDEDASFWSVSKEMLFKKNDRKTPRSILPSKKTDLINLDKSKDVLVWFGHSSYFMQIDGKRILVDPVLSDHASPFSFSIKAFNGTTIYQADDIPEIDYLFITHDHWDHLDYEAMVKLKPKIKKVITGLGNGAHFEKWGYQPKDLVELDWYENVVLDGNINITSVPARHFSGRGFKRNQTLWSAFVLQTPSQKIFIGGDGGYDHHFARIGKTYGPFDLAILENGQYNKNWKYIHLMPDDLIKAFNDLNAKRLFSVHNSKFPLANHAWDEPMEKVSASSKELNISLITPLIGEQVNLNDSTQTFTEWWKGIE